MDRQTRDSGPSNDLSVKSAITYIVLILNVDMALTKSSIFGIAQIADILEELKERSSSDFFTKFLSV